MRKRCTDTDDPQDPLTPALSLRGGKMGTWTYASDSKWRRISGVTLKMLRSGASIQCSCEIGSEAMTAAR